MRVLITGGAGFIGTYLARSLLKQGCEVTILDRFAEQIHGEDPSLQPDLADAVHLIKGDVSDKATLREGLVGVNAVAHLAAETGTGQSMYEVALYGRTNLMGSAVLYELLAKEPHRVERIAVASSRSVYGEGAYECRAHNIVYPKPRSSEEKKAGHFDPLCPVCGEPCLPTLTPESCPFQPSSFYGFTKQAQEQMAILFGNVLQIPTVALRYQNVFGAGQSLKNPYTGILAIFSNLARMGKEIQIFEDGEESRDFVYVTDVVQATVNALLLPLTGTHTVNVGSGVRTSVSEVARLINSYYGNKSSVVVNGRFREGDIRHGAADLTVAKSLLQYEPQWTFQDGLNRFMAWANESAPSAEGYERSLAEMSLRGLLHDRD